MISAAMVVCVVIALLAIAARTPRAGIGDIVRQFSLTQTRLAKLIRGASPVLSLPTALNVATWTGDWSTGPGLVLATTPDPLVFGVLVTQLQPFFNWNLTHSWTITFSPIMTATWQSASTWTVPLGPGISNITPIGPLPVSLGISYYNNVVRPAGTGSSQNRPVTSFPFPKAHAK